MNSSDRGSYMIIDGPKDLFRRDEQTGHLPNRHFEIHLGELEQPFMQRYHILADIHNRYCTLPLPSYDT